VGEVSRINLTIDRIVLRGFDPGVRKAVTEGLRAELSRVLADPAGRASLGQSRRTPVLKLGSVPVSPGQSGGRVLGTRIGGAIGKGLKP
jgi:hypothetical protein